MLLFGLLLFLAGINFVVVYRGLLYPFGFLTALPSDIVEFLGALIAIGGFIVGCIGFGKKS